MQDDWYNDFRERFGLGSGRGFRYDMFLNFGPIKNNKEYFEFRANGQTG
ncbi:hypothetical protein D3OALGA1CA_1500 [Olavius algarvensis associated proteobacterium Delta 3]|nr:hypothetical protein D3OALGA1CA_1500 [Olavius algarvensis associated proteobacterium Delta 3]CAB5127176.1 hypothetical protein D3OALGB2SA_3363 [Olavius algarvensis associated proteobacterium Delta 3]